MSNENRNGKGDKWRNTDYKKYYSGYDSIDWKKKDPVIDKNQNKSDHETKQQE